MALRKTDNADIRKRYPIYIEIGLIVALLLLIVGFRANWTSDSDFEVVMEEQETVELEEVQQTKQETQPPPPPRPPVPVEVPNDQELEDQNLDLDATLDLDETLEETSPPPPEPEDDGGDEQEVFMVVEEQPELIGGMSALNEEVEYPDFARKAGIEGRVFVQFVVDENGNVTQPTVLRSPHKLLSEEALRVVKEMKFKPGKQRGKSVKVKMSLPVTFKLN